MTAFMKFGFWHLSCAFDSRASKIPRSYSNGSNYEARGSIVLVGHACQKIPTKARLARSFPRFTTILEARAKIQFVTRNFWSSRSIILRSKRRRLSGLTRDRRCQSSQTTKPHHTTTATKLHSRQSYDTVDSIFLVIVEQISRKRPI